MKNRKILQIGKFYPPYWGGIEYVTDQINRECLESNISIETFAFGEEDSYEKRLNLFRFKFISIFRTPMSLNMLKFFFKRKKKYSSILVHWPNPWAVLLIFLAIKDTKIFLYWHASANKNLFLNFLVNFLLFLIKNKINSVILPTWEHQKTTPFFFQDIKKIEIKYPIKVNNEDNIIKKTKKYTFVSIGRLVPYKGYEVAIKAFNKIQRNLNNINYLIIGSGPLKKRLINMIYQFDLQEKIIIKDDCNDSEKYNYLAKSKILCFTSVSNQEMFGVTQIEAYAFGIPVITSLIKDSGVSYLAKQSKAAIITKINDTNEVADAMIKLLSNEDLYESFSYNAKEYYEKNFHNKKFISSFLQIL